LIRVAKVGVALLFFLFASSRAVLLRLAGHSRKPPFVVVTYHSVKRHERLLFERQMSHVLKVGSPVYADFEVGDARAHRFVAVTFDDGYHSILENALPVLRDRMIPATIFVPTNFLGNSPGWITDARHRDVDERLLTADELKRARTFGALIGSHGVSHRPLTEISKSEAFVELVESRRVLEQLLDQPVRLLALPYGAGNSDVFGLAARAGYSRVFLSVPVKPSGNPPAQRLGRVNVTPSDWRLEFWLKVRGAYQWLPSAIAAKGHVLNVIRAVTLQTARRAGLLLLSYLLV
jgi:peptidoglycan/xylan/chitin deacetylase (PgdA/CDA1 family)